MNPKNLIIGVLALTTIGGGIFAWQQYQRANTLGAEVATLTKAATERAERSQRRSSGDRPQTASAAADQPPADGPRPEGGRGDWQNRMGNVRSLLDSPEAAKLMASQQRGMLDARYAGLFKSLNLSPDQLAKMKDLLIEKQNAARDVMSVAREQGLDFRGNRSEIQQLVQQANADSDAALAAAIGQDKFSQYQSYEQTQPQRAVTSQIEQRLSYTSEPLTSAQNDQLVSLLAANTPAPSEGERGNRTFVATFAGPPGGAAMTFGMGGGPAGGVQITDQVITDAQSFLSASQVAVLRQVQSEQADQKKLQQLIMSGGENTGGAGGEGNGGNSTRGRRGRGGQ